jgi:hypothetical protein
MKSFIKILLVVLVALFAKVEVVSATITFPNIQETLISSSFYSGILAKTVSKFSEMIWLSVVKMEMI